MKKDQQQDLAPTAMSNVPHPDQKGILGKMIRTKALLAFNQLPITCKDEDSEGKAKRIIVELAKMHPFL